MADIRKEQELYELHRAIWRLLMNCVEAWHDGIFKSYVLGMMFYRYIS